MARRKAQRVSQRTIEKAVIARRVGGELLTRDAAPEGSKRRRFRFVAATEKPVLAWIPGRGEVPEALLMEPGAVEVPHALSLLDAHDRRAIVGRVTAWSIDERNARLIVEVECDDTAPGELAAERIRAGSLSLMSVGYSVESYTLLDNGETLGRFTGPAAIADKWQLRECSLVSVPADPGATVLREETTLTFDDTQPPAEERKMAKKINARTGEPVGNTEALNNRAVGDTTTHEHETDNRVLAEERTRVREVNNLLREAAPALADRAIEQGWDVERARNVAEGIRANAPNRAVVSCGGGVSFGADNQERLLKGASAALRMRAGILREDTGSPADKEAMEVGIELRSASLYDLAGEYLMQRGVRPPSGKAERFKAAFAERNERSGAGAFSHSTSDFVGLMLDAANKSAGAGYMEAELTFPRWTRKASIPDFRPRHVVNLSEIRDPHVVLENGEIPETHLKDSSESYALRTVGSIVSVTRQSLINDDLQLLTSVPFRMGASIGRYSQKVVSDILKLGNTSAVQIGGANLFNDSSHANLGTTAALSVESLQAAKAAMIKQTGLNGELVAVQPRFLIVAPGLETTALTLLNSTALPLAGLSSGIVNPFAGGGLQLIVDPWLAVGEGGSDFSWYLAGDPALHDTIEVGYLDGTEVPMVEEEAGFDVLGIRFRVVFDFAAKALDFRALHKNVGADPFATD